MDKEVFVFYAKFQKRINDKNKNVTSVDKFYIQ